MEQKYFKSTCVCCSKHKQVEEANDMEGQAKAAWVRAATLKSPQMFTNGLECRAIKRRDAGTCILRTLHLYPIVIFYQIFYKKLFRFEL